MNILIDQSMWKYAMNKNLKVSSEGDDLVIDNHSDHAVLLRYKTPFKKTHEEIKCEFYGEMLHGDSPTLKIIDKRRLTWQAMMLNSTNIISFDVPRRYYFAIKVEPGSKCIIHKIEITKADTFIDEKFSSFNSDILVISPSYPSVENKYLSGFVHSRVKEYKKHGVDVDVAVVYKSYTNSSRYQYEDINVNRISYADLRMLLGKKKYKIILIHFFDMYYFNVLEGCDISDKEVYIWVHGPETLYWDYPYFTTGYYSELNKISDIQNEEFNANDIMIRKLNDMSNVKFVFVSNWIKSRSEELIKIEFQNYEIIPNLIDTDLFMYQKKSSEIMKNVFMLRRYDDVNKYAVDISVEIIQELSKRKCFDKLVFNIYGKGNAFDMLFKPIKGFDNVHFFKQFFSHDEIAELHKQNGIALFPTRYDAQGVSMCEAGSSGLLVVSSNNDAVKEFIPSEYGNIIDTEDHIAYADFIERIIEDDKLFHVITNNTRSKIVDLCSYDATVKKEVQLIQSDAKKEKEEHIIEPDDNPVLSIIVPSYNVANFILKTLKSILEGNNNAEKIEIIVVNDGSTDSTVKVVKDYIENRIGENGVIRLIDKENGGHGSTINVGIQEARGKYLRIIDGDDWVNTKDLEKLVDILQDENSDIVLTDYSEDKYMDNTVSLNKRSLYGFMQIGKQYIFDDLYREYKFGDWGPVMATANIKLSKLREANFKLTEKSFYVDMEYNAFYLPSIDTISYYDLDIYRYYIGRAQQSTNIKVFSKVADQHRKVVYNILKFTCDTPMSQEKKNYICEKLILPMISTQCGFLIRSSEINELKTFVRNVKSMMNRDTYVRIMRIGISDNVKKKVKVAIRRMFFNKYTYNLAYSRVFSSGIGRKLRNAVFDCTVKTKIKP